MQFVTGADVAGELPEDLNWAALADPKATTVVFMGKRTFARLASELIAHGLAAETPALMAEAVGHPTQSLRRATVGTLGEDLAKAPTDQPAVILYGPLAD